MGNMWKRIEDLMTVDKARYKLGSSAPKGKIFVIDSISDEVWTVLSLTQHGSNEFLVETNAGNLKHLGISEECAQTLIDAAKKEIAEE